MFVSGFSGHLRSTAILGSMLSFSVTVDYMFLSPLTVTAAPNQKENAFSMARVLNKAFTYTNDEGQKSLR